MVLTMNTINSLSNNIVKEVCFLHTSKGRKSLQRFIVEGTRAIETFIAHGYEPIYLFTVDEPENEDQVNYPIYCVTESVMDKMSMAVTPSGVLAVFSTASLTDVSKLSSGLVLVNIQDPGNMGTLIRSCAAFGHKTVVIIEGCDPYNPKAIQATAGTFPLVSLFTLSWQQLCTAKKDLALVALTLNGKNSFTECNAQKSLFVIGNEANGLPKEYYKDFDKTVTIKTSPDVESLNAAVAGSIALALTNSQNIEL